MPFSYVVYKAQRLVVSTGSGILTGEEIRECQVRTTTDPDFNPEFNQLVDVRQVTDLKMFIDEFKSLARRKVFTSGSRRAFVAASPHVFGMGRVWQAHSELSTDNPSEIQVFYDLPSALEWLGLESLPEPARSGAAKKIDGSQTADDEKIA